MNNIRIKNQTISFLALVSLAACQATNADGTVSSSDAAPSSSSTAAPLPTSQVTQTSNTTTTFNNASGNTTVSNSTTIVNSAPSGSVDLTYYTVTKSANPESVATPISLVASCVAYQGFNYCWDNNIKQQSTHSGMVYNYYNFSYWGMTSANPAIYVPWGSCYGNCQSDFMIQPTLMTANLISYMNHAQSTVAQVFSTGVPKTVTCTTIDSTHISCQDFIIDLGQTAI